MEQSPYGSRRREEPELSMREWALRAQISRENTKSRRFSGSHIRSFREEARSFRSNVTISSTASSPGYTLREEIDPSTYSFTTALKALQARSVYNSWECLSPDGFALNSKWNEAEKYICNPYSGEVPMECLSAKTLSGKSFRSLTSRITMSAPLVYSSNIRPQVHAKPALASSTKQDHTAHLPVKENKKEGTTRDVGTQSTPPQLSSSSPSPASTPSIMERALKRCETEGGDSPNSNNAKLKAEDKVQEKETSAKEETTKREGNKREGKTIGEDQRTWRWCGRSRSSSSSSRGQGGCLSWMRKRQRDKHEQGKKNVFLLNHEEC